MSPRLSDALLRVQSDERLVMLARSGHERAFVAIVERYRRPLHAFARRLVGDGRVEDVLQQAFVSAWTALNAGAEVRHLRGWLHQIVRNAAIAAGQAPGTDELSEALIGGEGPQDEVERRLEVRETLRHVARLPDRQRRALVGTAMEGRSREEIAESLGLSEGAVRGLVHRARTTLRAAASALTPLPTAAWAASGGGRGTLPTAERIAELVAGAGSASLAGAAVKAGTVVAVSGALATSVATDLPRLHHHPHLGQRAPLAARDAVERPPATTPVAAGPPRAAASVPAQSAPTLPAPARVVRVAAAPRPQPVVRRQEPREGDRHEDRGEHEKPVQPSTEGEHETRAVQASDDGGDGGGDRSSSSGGSGESVATTEDGGYGASGSGDSSPSSGDDGGR